MKHAFYDKYTISVMFCGCQDNFKKSEQMYQIMVYVYFLTFCV